jgi:hypothetical protein
MQMDLQAASMVSSGVGCKGGGTALFSSQLDSDRFPAFCRGQGAFYAVEPSDPFQIPKRFETHFNFSGAYQGVCCYCAMVNGYNFRSFLAKGCYHCKRSELLIREFSKLKHRASTISSWLSCGWAGLSDSVIDLILKLVVEEKPLLILKN